MWESPPSDTEHLFDPRMACRRRRQGRERTDLFTSTPETASSDTLTL